MPETVTLCRESETASGPNPAYFAGQIEEQSQPWGKLIDELRQIMIRGDDWDGQGASTPNRDCVEAAIRWIQAMSEWGESAIAPSYVSAAPGGEIVIAWQKDSVYLEAEIAEPNEVEWMQSIEGSPTEHWTSPVEGYIARH